MSRNNNNNKKNTVSDQKYCKVCQDAGKSEAEFRSHFTRESRDPNSKVTCPILLALECRYCYKNGHTVKYCPIIKEREKMHRREEASYRQYEMDKKASKPIEKPKQAPRNVFTCLNCDSDDENNNQLTEEFPELINANITVNNNNNNKTSNYAAALATAIPEPKVIKLAPVPLPKTTVPATIPVPAKKIEFPNIIKKTTMLSWADEESDSSDDEEEEEELYNSPINSKNKMVNGYDSDW